MRIAGDETLVVQQVDTLTCRTLESGANPISPAAGRSGSLVPTVLTLVNFNTHYGCVGCTVRASPGRPHLPSSTHHACHEQRTAKQREATDHGERGRGLEHLQRADEGQQEHPAHGTPGEEEDQEQARRQGEHARQVQGEGGRAVASFAPCRVRLRAAFALGFSHASTYLLLSLVSCFSSPCSPVAATTARPGPARPTPPWARVAPTRGSCAASAGHPAVAPRLRARMVLGS